jgi:hypothetical protein
MSNDDMEKIVVLIIIHQIHFFPCLMLLIPKDSILKDFRISLGIAFNPSNNDMDITHDESNTVSVISTTIPVQPPTATTITSSTDGNGNPVQIGGSTVSTSITFHVTATADTNPIAGFECRLDNSAFYSCATTNPGTIIFNNLATNQQHTFEVIAVDTQANVDPTPATFSWTFLTPKQAIQKLISTIDGMHLPRGTTKSLKAILNADIRQLSHNSDVAACNILAAFLHQVNAYEGSRLITSHSKLLI